MLHDLTTPPDSAFFPGRAATIYYRAPSPKHSVLTTIKHETQAGFRMRCDAAIGTLGILHPTVLENFDISYPCSALEFNLEPFKKEIVQIYVDYNRELQIRSVVVQNSCRTEQMIQLVTDNDKRSTFRE